MWPWSRPSKLRNNRSYHHVVFSSLLQKLVTRKNQMKVGCSTDKTESCEDGRLEDNLNFKKKKNTT